ncbi:hypothetical protein [Streptosporangium sp. V21-05]
MLLDLGRARQVQAEAQDDVFPFSDPGAAAPGDEEMARTGYVGIGRKP